MGLSEVCQASTWPVSVVEARGDLDLTLVFRNNRLSVGLIDVKRTRTSMRGWALETSANQRYPQ